MVIFFLAFLAGIIVKIVDWLEDDKKSGHYSKYILSVIYGLIIGYLISNATFSAIFLGALIAQILSKKIDTLAHRIGFLTAIFVSFFLGLAPIEFPVFIFFLILAFLDEIEFLGKLKPLSDYRPFLKAGALVFIIFGRIDYFLGIIIFDFGYEIVKTISNKKDK